ncbi:hypothetical protein [Streptomyces halobius]|uniref:Uncharacterized protein n=1 Tax=Streptomyces halobius TaxID=2879846 RepID=A0ABY4MJ12_9ACTN|nr:hypothetical protein [Streptomyces halobius]UQA97548.1 hypothetical protein K9S39_41915 [Streptomyces halobius]
MKDRKRGRLDWPDHVDYVTDWTSAARKTAELVPAELTDAQFVIGLAVPACAHTAYAEPDGTRAAW